MKGRRDETRGGEREGEGEGERKGEDERLSYQFQFLHFMQLVSRVSFLSPFAMK